MDGMQPSPKKELPSIPTEAQRVVTSAELFAGARVVVIEHAGQQYRLLITRNDRLILQK
jgi:hemin uptake protein HemP